MTKRKTRASNTENDTDVCRTNPHKKKRSSRKSSSTGKLLIDEQRVVNTLVDEPAFTTLEPVPLDYNKGVSDRENSPSPLIIDINRETNCSQSMMSNYFPQRERIGECLPRRTFNENENHSENIDRARKESLCEENRTPVVDRSADGQFSSSVRSTSRIVVSLDQRPRDSNEDLNRNHRTSTPIRPSRAPPMNIGSSDDYIDSFSVDAIPQETYNILSRFSEFRNLIKALNNERKKCQTWTKDFARLQRNYKQLEENSFPRPPASAMTYLVDLVDSIRQSGGRGDPRTDEQLARALGENPIFLMGLKDVTPQQTALNLFNHLYPGYEPKLKLDSVKKLEAMRPDLLETMLTFSQRACPGTIYKLDQLRCCLSNSIRGARYSWGEMQQTAARVGTIQERSTTDNTRILDDNYLNRNTDHSTGIDDMLIRERERERRLDEDCF